MDSIARGAGVTKQTVYRYFSTKEELFQEALEAQRKRLHGVIWTLWKFRTLPKP